jgi:hypothetical protein
MIANYAFFPHHLLPRQVADEELPELENADVSPVANSREPEGK